MDVCGKKFTRDEVHELYNSHFAGEEYTSLSYTQYLSKHFWEVTEGGQTYFVAKDQLPTAAPEQTCHGSTLERWPPGW